jgi:hypothetical protein
MKRKTTDVLHDTHRSGVFSDAVIQQLVRERDAVDCVTPSGGVVAMRSLMIHASSKSVDARRIRHIEYVVPMELDSGVILAAA